MTDLPTAALIFASVAWLHFVFVTELVSLLRPLPSERLERFWRSFGPPRNRLPSAIASTVVIAICAGLMVLFAAAGGATAVAAALELSAAAAWGVSRLRSSAFVTAGVTAIPARSVRIRGRCPPRREHSSKFGPCS